MDCGYSFCVRRQKKKRYSWQFVLEVVRRHVEERLSFRLLAKRYRETHGLKVSTLTLQRMVARVAKRCKSPLEMSEDLQCREWRGYLIVDDKHIRLKGSRRIWYVAVDSRGDILHAQELSERTVTDMVAFFARLRDRVHYPLKGLTTDQEILFWMAFPRVYPGKPHQMCIKHALDSLDLHLGYQKQRAGLERLKRRVQDQVRSLPAQGVGGVRTQWRSDRTWKKITEGYHAVKQLRLEMREVNVLRKAIRRVILAQTYEKALSRWASFHRHPLRTHPLHRKICEYITPRWQKLTVHYHYRGMPRTNNVAENTMRQLERRLKTIEGFGNRQVMQGYLYLLIAYLRAKPYTDCRGSRKYRNGLSRLELAGAETKEKDWLRLCLK